ncbi:MAG TPA: sigma-70 family RNA polymerase sigma factor [Urbifossiella sp.]|nr:sigma-70 family RNA polymerase sigma factor [Urbifossiella sp.]
MPRPFLPRLLAAVAPAGENAADADLLRAFARERNAAALELVVRRHAAAVWAACRRVLPEADAEDAFQAAFLVLVRKPGSVRGSNVGGWLYRVAVTAALKRKAAGRRELTGSPTADLPDRGPVPADDLARAELATAVHEELARLPDRYRLPVVLCDLEGETQPAAATRLGWPVGSVASRLSRARALLRDRLARRGFAPAGAVLVLPFAAAPGRLVTAVVAAATGAAPPSLPVSILATGVLSAMHTAKLKLAGAVLVSAGLIGMTGFGVYSASAQPAPVPRPVDPPPPPLPVAPPRNGWPVGGFKSAPATVFPDIVVPRTTLFQVNDYPALFDEQAIAVVPGDDTYRRLRKAQLRQIQQYLHMHNTRMEIGQFQGADVFNYFQQCNEARTVAIELWANDPRKLDSWLTDLVRLAKAFEQFTTARVTAGTDPPQALHRVAAQRLAAEAILWKHRNPGQPR